MQFNLQEHPRLTLTALEPTRLLQWSSAALGGLLAAQPLIDKGVHTLWNRDMVRPAHTHGCAQPRARLTACPPTLWPLCAQGRTLSQRDEEQLRSRRSAYAQVLRALTAASEQPLSAADVAFVQEHRARRALDDEAHERCLDELAAAGALPPHALQSLRGLRLAEREAEPPSEPFHALARLRGLVSASLLSVSEMASELSLAASPSAGDSGSAAAAEPPPGAAGDKRIRGHSPFSPFMPLGQR